MTEGNDVGKLILRLALGSLILLHGAHKLLDISGTIAWLGPMVASHGVPEVLAYLVFVGEVIAPIMVIFGFYTRLGGLLIVINMVVAILLVHLPHFLTLGASGGWALQLQGMYLLTALALVFLGGGRYGINRY